MKFFITITIILLSFSSIYSQRIPSRQQFTGTEMSSVVTGSNSIYAADGSRTNGLTSESYNDKPSWWIGDLGSIKTINSVKVYSSSSLKNAYIIYSKTPFRTKNLNTLISCNWYSYYQVTDAVNVIQVPIGIPAQYVGVFSEDDAILLTEVEVLGDELGPPEEICDDFIDNDGNSLQDCSDYNCGIGFIEVDITLPSCTVCTDGSICINTGNATEISLDGGQTWLGVDPGVEICREDLGETEFCLIARNNFCAMQYENENDGSCTIEIISVGPTFPPLSDLGEDILNDLEDECTTGDDPVICDGGILTGGNSLVNVMVDGPAIFSEVRDLIAGAEFEIDIGLFVWNPGSEGSLLIRDGLLSNQASREGSIPLRIMLSAFPFASPHMDVYNELQSFNLDLSKWDIQITTVIDYNDGNLHDKLFVVDGRRMVITGANVQPVHDSGSPWRDTGYRIEGDAATAGLTHFDFNWTRVDKHWACANGNCNERSNPWPIPSRSWLPQATSATGATNIMYAGKTLDLGSDNMQNAGWVSMMENANSHINVATPNINSDEFFNGIIAAIERGVEVNLLTGRLFNASAVNFFGGYNREIVSDLKQTLRDIDPALLDRLHVKWFSADGQEEIIGNGPFAMHTKYMSVDDQVAMVGTGNQDYFSWDHSGEINFIIDNEADVLRIEEAFFDDDFNKGIDQVVEFYEGYNITQDIIAIENTIKDHSRNFTNDATYLSVNDEARSLTINNTPAGRRIRIFDESNFSGRFRDDWMEIVTLQDVKEVKINSLHSSFTTSEVRVIYNNHDGLNGKVSFYQVDDYTPEPRILFFENFNASGKIICHLDLDPSVGHVNFTNYSPCENDEAKSVKLLDMKAGMRLRIFDSSNGSQNDDFIVITIKQDFPVFILGNLEPNQTIDNENIRVVYNEDNGLNGKVSSFRDY